MQKIKLKIYVCIIILVFIIIYILELFYNSQKQAAFEKLSENIVRLHVVANSDASHDQALKLKVRDELVKYIGDIIDECKSAQESEEVLIENKVNIINVAQKVIKDNGYDYDVKALMGKFIFPAKMYGQLVFPPGQYKALKIIIGKGEGSNWWCVLFPPLCFIDNSYNTVPDFVRKNLKEKLSKEEYELIFPDDTAVNIGVTKKLKIVEMLKNTGIKVSTIMDELFGTKKKG